MRVTVSLKSPKYGKRVYVVITLKLIWNRFEASQFFPQRVLKSSQGLTQSGYYPDGILLFSDPWQCFHCLHVRSSSRESPAHILHLLIDLRGLHGWGLVQGPTKHEVTSGFQSPDQKSGCRSGDGKLGLIRCLRTTAQTDKHVKILQQGHEGHLFSSHHFLHTCLLATNSLFTIVQTCQALQVDDVHIVNSDAAKVQVCGDSSAFFFFPLM